VGKPRQEIVGRTVFDISPPGLANVYFQKDKDLISDPGVQIYENQVRCADGSIRDVIFWKATYQDPTDQGIGLVGVIGDITARKGIETRLQETLDLNQKLLDASPLGITAYRADTGHCVLANPAMGVIVGATQQQILALNFRGLASWKDSGLYDIAEKCLEDQETKKVTVEMHTTFGKNIWAMATFTPFETNHEPHLLLMLEDVTERILADQKLQEANGRLERLAREDGLTGLANRRHFNERLEAEIRRTRRVGKGLALITCDIDYFKRYNDNYGHPMGDACLITVSKVMQGLFKRGGDLVARIGGEEFAILLPETQLEAATKLAEALRLAVESAGIPHEYSKIAPVITISLGVAAASVEEERSSEWFMGEADGALYRSKVGGRNRVSIGESTLENLG
jgi:diguanylate cyclase (GGDEF)-like protein/PAS domain S-box-containing protein